MRAGKAAFCAGAGEWGLGQRGPASAVTKSGGITYAVLLLANDLPYHIEIDRIVAVETMTLCSQPPRRSPVVSLFTRESGAEYGTDRPHPLLNDAGRPDADVAKRAVVENPLASLSHFVRSHLQSRAKVSDRPTCLSQCASQSLGLQYVDGPLHGDEFAARPAQANMRSLLTQPLEAAPLKHRNQIIAGNARCTLTHAAAARLDGDRDAFDASVSVARRNLFSPFSAIAENERDRLTRTRQRLVHRIALRGDLRQGGHGNAKPSLLLRFEDNHERALDRHSRRFPAAIPVPC